MDPATIAMLAAALSAAIQEAIKIRDAAHAGQITGADAIRQLNDFQSGLASSEATNRAEAVAAEALRFGGK